MDTARNTLMELGFDPSMDLILCDNIQAERLTSNTEVRNSAGSILTVDLSTDIQLDSRELDTDHRIVVFKNFSEADQDAKEKIANSAGKRSRQSGLRLTVVTGPNLNPRLYNADLSGGIMDIR